MAKLVDIVMPTGAQEGTESVLANWLKKAGEQVNIHEPILEISTDKVMVEVAAPATGVLRETLKNPNDMVEPGDVLGRIEVGVEGRVEAAQEISRTGGGEKAHSSDAAQELSPAVRKLLKEHNVDPMLVKGSGRGGRITHQDVLDFVAKKQGGDSTQTNQGSSRKVPHTPMRRKIAEHMVESLLHTAPHVTTVFSCDLSKVLEHREKQGTKLTLTAYFVAAAVAALKAVPEVNSRYHQDALELFDDCNIGIATALERSGLIVPVIHQAQKLDLFGIASTLHDLTTRARAGTLEPSAVQGGTFTISNHGVGGSLFAAPIIINQPQSAILGIGKLEKRVVIVEEGGKEVTAIKPMVYVTLTIDHRALDGYTANVFLEKFVEALEGWK